MSMWLMARIIRRLLFLCLVGALVMVWLRPWILLVCVCVCVYPAAVSVVCVGGRGRALDSSNSKKSQKGTGLKMETMPAPPNPGPSAGSGGGVEAMALSGLNHSGGVVLPCTQFHPPNKPEQTSRSALAGQEFRLIIFVAPNACDRRTRTRALAQRPHHA